MNKKILVIPNSLENLSDILKTNVDGIVLSIKDLSVNSNVYFTIDDIKLIDYEHLGKIDMPVAV